MKFLEKILINQIVFSNIHSENCFLIQNTVKVLIVSAKFYSSKNLDLNLSHNFILLNDCFKKIMFDVVIFGIFSNSNTIGVISTNSQHMEGSYVRKISINKLTFLDNIESLHFYQKFSNNKYE